MNPAIYTSYTEYEKFVNEYYPKSSLSCSHYRKIISKLFTIIELSDIYSEIMIKTEFQNYFIHVKHQFLLMTFNLPNYNSFFNSSIQRSISESLLRMTSVYLGQTVEESNGAPFFRMQGFIKNSSSYKTNLNNIKDSCDLLFSYFGRNSKVMHNDTKTKKTNMDYIIGFNMAPNDKEVESLSKFIGAIYDTFLITYSGIFEINDFTLNLPAKMQLKNVIGNEAYKEFFVIKENLPSLM